MKNIAIIYLHNMSIASVYPAEAPEQHKYGGDWGRAITTAHIEVPEAIDPKFIASVELVDGEYVFTQDDAAKATQEAADLQKGRDDKLALMRKIVKEDKMPEIDIMINELTIGDRVDTTAVRNYRQAIKDITNAYKDEADELVGTDALDALADDLSDFTWPSKP